jgi:hypothetical protein
MQAALFSAAKAEISEPGRSFEFPIDGFFVAFHERRQAIECIFAEKHAWHG